MPSLPPLPWLTSSQPQWPSYCSSSRTVKVLRLRPLLGFVTLPWATPQRSPFREACNILGLFWVFNEIMYWMTAMCQSLAYFVGFPIFFLRLTFYCLSTFSSWVLFNKATFYTFMDLRIMWQVGEKHLYHVILILSQVAKAVVTPSKAGQWY